MLAFHCSRCHGDHGKLPLSYVIGVPNKCFDIREQERKTRVSMDDETCSVDGRHFFLRGNIELPIVDYERSFVWTVWAAMRPHDFKRTQAKWMRADPDVEPVYQVTLGSELPCYPHTLGLPAVLEIQGDGALPAIRLAATNSHLLAQAQHQGIDLAEVQRIAEYVVHGSTVRLRRGLR
jgi:hypothetical protein